jgi:hypothetical protein
MGYYLTTNNQVLGITLVSLEKICLHHYIIGGIVSWTEEWNIVQLARLEGKGMLLQEGNLEVIYFTEGAQGCEGSVHCLRGRKGIRSLLQQ